MIRFIATVLVIACCASPAFAQPIDAGVPDAPPDAAPPPDAPAPAEAPPSAPPPAPACTAKLDVHAVDPAHHEMAGATVTVNGELLGVTDDAGRLELSSRCPGDVTLVVERPDAKSATETVSVPATSSVEVMMQPLDNEVIEVHDKPPPPTEMHSTAVITGEALERTRGRAFSDALAEVAGVTQLRSASGMAKPIVRGQFGRRLLMLVDGVRHRSQDWGLDHAPEIDPFIADSITVVRGAAGVRYGPDAIGGAVLADPPPLLREPGLKGEGYLTGMGGTGFGGLGGSVAARLRGAPASAHGLAWMVEGSYKKFAAPSTPDYALDNTGGVEWNGGATVGYRHGAAEYTLSYLHYQAELGVCSCLHIESRDDFLAQLQRDRPIGSELYTSDFKVERPYQAPAHDLALARARWVLPSGALTATYALQYDHRREYDIVREATTGPQYDFRLTTNDAEVVYEHEPIHLSDHWHLRGSAGVVGMAQVHRYSGLQLVPDHEGEGAGAFAIERLVGHTIEAEAGVRYDVLHRTADIVRQDFLRLVRSGQLAMDACGDDSGDLISCGSTFHTVSASLGGMYRFTDELSLKLDLSTASRPPDPDEQYLNGTAPTFPVLALGKPDLGPETTYSASTTVAYRSDRINAELSAFANRIDDYIYFAPAIGPDGQPIFDVLIKGTFPRFTTRPIDAMFWGLDGGVTAAPAPWLELDATVSMVRAKNRDDGSYLAFIPPDQARASVTYKRASLGSLGKSYAQVNGTFVRRQDRYELAADFAPPPDGYVLLGAEVGTETTIGGHTAKFGLTGTNLTNARYRDYTSLLRYFADQPGLQLLFRAGFQFE